MQTRKKRKRKIIWGALLLVLVLIAAYGIFLRPKAARYDEETAKNPGYRKRITASPAMWSRATKKIVTATSPVRVNPYP